MVIAETAVNGIHLLRAIPEDTLNGPYPQPQVGIDGILYKDMKGCAFQGLGYFLNQERIGCGAGTQPDSLKSCLEHQLNMTGRGHFGTDR